MGERNIDMLHGLRIWELTDSNLPGLEPVTIMVADIQERVKYEELAKKTNSTPWTPSSTNETAANGWDLPRLVNPRLDSPDR